MAGPEAPIVSLSEPHDAADVEAARDPPTEVNVNEATDDIAPTTPPFLPIPLSVEMPPTLVRETDPSLLGKTKLAFFIGTCNILATVYMVGAFPWFLPWYYSVKFPVMIFLRYYQYQKRSWHYFLLDFCYYANTFLLVYLHAFPSDTRLFQVIFAITNGPLLWAVSIFGNSMVFHSIDKTTSLLIHLTPPLVSFAIRWHQFLDVSRDEGFWWRITPCEDIHCGSPGVVEMFALPLLFVLAHQVLYVFLVFVVLDKKISDDPESLTMFKYLVTGNKNGPTFRATACAGPRLQKPFFSLLYLVFAALTIAPTYLYYRSQALHTVVIVVNAMAAVWRGAGFYVHVFSFHGKKLKLEKKMKKLQAPAAEQDNVQVVAPAVEKSSS